MTVMERSVRRVVPAVVIENLTPSVLSLDVRGDFIEAEVVTIRRRRGDSLANGAR